MSHLIIQILADCFFLINGMIDGFADIGILYEGSFMFIPR